MPSNLIGQVLNSQYRVETFIASGGMGVVYRVWDLKRNVPLAMKVLHADLADDPSIFKRFQREARALQKLAHPNIVPFYGLERTSDSVFLLQRFINGPTLKDILRARGSLPVEEALIYLKALCAALGYAHIRGVIHCDVKPGNVMVDQGGNIYLTDFGIARHAESTTTTLATAGTAAYMAPEQIRGEAVRPETDVYALGVLLFEMLTGQRPFTGRERSTENAGSTLNERIRYSHLMLPPPNPILLNPSIPPSLVQVLMKALAKEPEGRYTNTVEILAAACRAAGTMPEEIPDRATVSVDQPAQMLSFQPTFEDRPSLTKSVSNFPQQAEEIHFPPFIPKKAKGKWILWVAGSLAMLLIIAIITAGGNPDAGTLQTPSQAAPASDVDTLIDRSPAATSTDKPARTPQITVATALKPVMFPPPINPPSATVLWDVGHGPYNGRAGSYEPNGEYSDLAKLLSGIGILLVGGNLSELFDHDAVVICAPSAYGSGFTSDEVGFIEEYVREGGGLLILGEFNGFVNHIQPVADKFGILTAQEPALNSINTLSGFPIFEGVSSVDFLHGGSLLATSPNAEPVAWEGSNVAIVIENYSEGRIMTIGDSSLFENIWLTHNETFAINVFNWITFLSD